MSLFAIADLHLSLGTDKPMDIFNGWDDYVSRLTKNWCNLVLEEDTVVIAGDISWAMRLADTKKDFEYINSLPGKKILLKGNHDYWWETLSKLNKFTVENDFSTLNFLFNNSYECENYVVCGTRGWLIDSKSEDDLRILDRETGRLRLSLESAAKSGKQPVVFLHYPPIYGNFESSQLIDIMCEYGVKKCYYGHIHGSNMIRGSFNGEYKGINFKLISCDAVSFVPQLIR